MCDCLIAIRILELEHSSSVNGTLQISGCERVGYVPAQPPAEGHSLTVIAIMWHVQILYYYFFFSLQGILVIMCKVINWYFMPLTQLVCSRHWWQMALKRELVEQLTPRCLRACILSLDGILYQTKWDHLITENINDLCISSPWWSFSWCCFSTSFLTELCVCVCVLACWPV